MANGAQFSSLDQRDPFGGKRAAESWRCDEQISSINDADCTAQKWWSINGTVLHPPTAHAIIGMLGAVKVLTNSGLPAAEVANVLGGNHKLLCVEHPAGELSWVFNLDQDGAVNRAGLVCTARKFMDGLVFL